MSLWNLEWTWTLLIFECLQALLFDWSWFEQNHSGRISSLGTEKARIWAGHVFLECPLDGLFQMAWKEFFKWPLSKYQSKGIGQSKSPLLRQSKDLVHANQRTWFTCLSKLSGHNAGSKVPLACQSKCPSIMPIEMFLQNANRRVFQNDNWKVFQNANRSAPLECQSKCSFRMSIEGSFRMPI